MKVLLANPPCRTDVENGFERAFVRAGSRWPFSTTVRKGAALSYLPFPFYLGYTAALLEKGSSEVLVNDALTLNKTLDYFVEETIQQQPDIILYETATPTISYDLDLARRLKNYLPKTIIALAGPHTSIFPEETLRENSFVDFVFVREYELSFSVLVERLHNGRLYSDIPGLGFRNGGEIQVNKPEPIDPLDQLPPPARHLFPENGRADPAIYWDGFCQYKPAIQMHATRGCPFLCNFCLWNTVMYGNGKYRTFDVRRVVEEMGDCQEKFGAREIYFDDDTFTANKPNVLNLCREIKRQGLKINWSVMGDAMVTDEEMVEAMADAGCIAMKFGVESGDEEVLRRIQKPVKFDKLKKFTDWCAKRGIKTHATFTFGLSGETRQTMNASLELAKTLDVDTVQFSMTTPFPGTRYHDEVKSKGLLMVEEYGQFDGASQSIVRFENLTNNEVQTFWRKASGRWLRSKIAKPHWVRRQVTNLARAVEGQGLGVVWKRARRIAELVSQW